MALGNVFGAGLPSEEGSLKTSPVLPSPHSPREVPSGAGNVLPAHPASTACTPREARGGQGACRSTSTRGQRRFHPVFGTAELLADTAAVNSEQELGTGVIKLQHEMIPEAPRQLWTCFSAPSSSLAEAKEPKLQVNAKLQNCCAHELFHSLLMFRTGWRCQVRNLFPKINGTANWTFSTNCGLPP